MSQTNRAVPKTFCCPNCGSSQNTIFVPWRPWKVALVFSGVISILLILLIPVALVLDPVCGVCAKPLGYLILWVSYSIRYSTIPVDADLQLTGVIAIVTILGAIVFVLAPAILALAFRLRFEQKCTTCQKSWAGRFDWSLVPEGRAALGSIRASLVYIVTAVWVCIKKANFLPGRPGKTSFPGGWR